MVRIGGPTAGEDNSHSIRGANRRMNCVQQAGIMPLGGDRLLGFLKELSRFSKIHACLPTGDRYGLTSWHRRLLAVGRRGGACLLRLFAAKVATPYGRVGGDPQPDLRPL